MLTETCIPSWRWETAMMNTTEGEGTSSGEREVTMTAQEKERTDAEMTGMTGKMAWCGKSPKISLSYYPGQGWRQTSCSCLTFRKWKSLVAVLCTQTGCKWYHRCVNVWLFLNEYPREWDRGRERRSRGEYRDYDRGRRERFTPPRHDMSPQQKRMRRDWWD